MITISEVGLRQALARVDWTFSATSAPTRTVHGFHWFPGNFIPQIPSFLIQLLSDTDDLVVDPFCGSGTTGVEALRLGRRARLSDVNRASIQVSRGKIAALSPKLDLLELRSIPLQLIWDAQLRTEKAGRNGEGSDPELSGWFHTDTLSQLRYLWRFIENTELPLRELLELIFTDVLFDCASTGGASTSSGGRRRHHWGWIADNVRPRPPRWHDAMRLFREKVNVATKVISCRSEPALKSVRVAREDVRKLGLGDASADLVVTSPPYLGMIDYAKANRLTYMWMGWQMEADRNVEIGARYRRHRAHSTDEYRAEMKGAISEVARVLRPGGFCAIVIGTSRKFPEGANIVFDLLNERLTGIWGPERRISTRTRVAERLGREPEEWIGVFQKR